jgi:hypothetical protein
MSDDWDDCEDEDLSFEELAERLEAEPLEWDSEAGELVQSAE